MLLLLVCFASALSFVQCHSWLACTDYLEENGVFWDQGKCRAFARHSETWCPRDALFGLDFGFDFRGSSQDVACKTTRDDTNAYTQKHPMAVFYPGQKVILVHPTKVSSLLNPILRLQIRRGAGGSVLSFIVPYSYRIKLHTCATGFLFSIGIHQKIALVIKSQIVTGYSLLVTGIHKINGSNTKRKEAINQPKVC